VINWGALNKTEQQQLEPIGRLDHSHPSASAKKQDHASLSGSKTSGKGGRESQQKPRMMVG